jgi:hypothetical protein
MCGGGGGCEARRNLEMNMNLVLGLAGWIWKGVR